MENKQINNPTRSELITDFVKSNPEYYIKEFQKIGSKPSFSFSFNLYAYKLNEKENEGLLPIFWNSLM